MNKTEAIVIKEMIKRSGIKVFAMTHNQKSGTLSIRTGGYTDYDISDKSEYQKETIARVAKAKENANKIVELLKGNTELNINLYTRRYSGFSNEIGVVVQ